LVGLPLENFFPLTFLPLTYKDVCMKHSLQVTTAILISSFVSAAFGAGLSYYWVQQAKEELAALVRAQLVQSEKISRDVEAPIVVEVPREVTIERPGKDEAWEQWYREPEHCGMNVSEADFVGCVNHKMRARKDFERVWNSMGSDSIGSIESDPIETRN